MAQYLTNLTILPKHMPNLFDLSLQVKVTHDLEMTILNILLHGSNVIKYVHIPSQTHTFFTPRPVFTNIKQLFMEDCYALF